MAKNRLVNTKFWSDTYVANLDPLEKLLFLYLITNQYTNLSGIYEIPIKQIALDTGIDRENLEKVLLPRFAESQKIYYIDGWVYVVNFQKHQKASGNIKAGIENAMNDIPIEIRVKIEKIRKNEEQITHNGVMEYFLKMSNEVLKPVDSAAISSGLKNKIFKRDKNKCINCGSKEKLEIHHIIPFSAGGKTIEENLQVLCQNCHKKITIAYLSSSQIPLSSSQTIESESESESESEFESKPKGDKSPVQEIVNYFFQLKDWDKFTKEDFKQKNIIYGRYTRDAKELLSLSGGVEKAKEALDKIKKWGEFKNLDWGISTAIKKFGDITSGKLKTEKDKKPFYWGYPMYKRDDCWYVIKDNKHTIFRGEDSEIEWK